MMGTRIAALRRNLGMSQAQLAACLQVSPSAVGMYEQGRREPAVEVLLAMAKIFDVSMDYLLTGAEQENKEEQTVSQVLTDAVIQTEQMLCRRGRRPFSREELAVLLAAMLIEG